MATVRLKKNHSLLLLLNNNLRINLNDKLPLNNATTDKTYNCNNLKQHQSPATLASGALVKPASTGTTRSDVIGQSSGFISSLKPSPTLSLLSSVTNLFYHHRKAFRRKNGTGRGAVAVTHGRQPIGTNGDARQLNSAVTVVVLLHSIILVVVVAFATATTITTATIGTAALGADGLVFTERPSLMAEAQRNSSSSIQSTATVELVQLRTNSFASYELKYCADYEGEPEKQPKLKFNRYRLATTFDGLKSALLRAQSIHHGTPWALN
uniref:Uncharacterized protein n=1 Tax=Anopheles dirus TaxID=7168 RepID=A0A182NSM4_9DIPT